jgi:predicted dehydrogenase
MAETVFSIIGGGNRAGYFLRIAAALPGRFRVAGLMVRDEAKGRALSERWKVPAVRTLDELLGIEKPAFVVISVGWPGTPVYIRELAGRKVPSLAETPPAPDLDGLNGLADLIRAGARAQVAEQYLFQPLHAARLSMARKGLLGAVNQVQVSVAHGYHGISIIRSFLGAGFGDAEITARSFTQPFTENPAGPGAAPKVRDSHQLIAWLDFGGKLGVFDFCGDQYFSWFMEPRFMARGDRGEMTDWNVRYLTDSGESVALSLRRADAGHENNLEGYYHKGILAGNEWVYRNPFVPARLTEDELAGATELAKMSEYAAGGLSFYGLPDACQDHYLSLMMERAARSGEKVRTTRRSWALDKIETNL